MNLQLSVDFETVYFQKKNFDLEKVKKPVFFRAKNATVAT